MERRTYLRSLGVAGVAGVAGCLDTVEQAVSGDRTADHDGPAILPPPDHPTGSSYPTYGEEFPSFSIPDPIAETTVSLEDFVGEKPFLMTYFFTTCPDGACPALLLRLRWIQEDAAANGYEDDIGLLAFTFDPERDTPDVLSEYATQRSIDYEADNWHFLRPETSDEAEATMTETFEMALKRIEDDDTEDGADADDDGHGDHDGNGDEDGDHDHDDNDDHDDHDHGEYTFSHNNVVTLVNEDGIVERGYPQAVQSDRAVDNETIVEDVRTVVGVE
ncbi:SCO family protein [Natronorubrum sp. JWXQ-INN-674]|uniref:SCO family protein n=1 Tax=Natronorubrum halalkaliphilum TaxID=2691917 RepID=A0A6B0VPW1_9EURY|nr:SCO family protein [Natronorubrum halalkaliphilum]MXV63335.1 SCO family protein [Natronorubrum halalkaliphilum]